MVLCYSSPDGRRRGQGSEKRAPWDVWLPLEDVAQGPHLTRGTACRQMLRLDDSEDKESGGKRAGVWETI
jgi:hypothetical protein